ncbi:conserved protein of unknown function [Nocardia cyriacigeorgica GUH-2]|uniref:Uncharacterized protein n=1 Tax=Nocardia cyriacigeorgica (strain GUH-2) TaxID=1127134 RepID=H6R204_NOCCG|nr:conserved protein of unknown function [Nocardia cyriacigeorgica GUH-2]
MRRLGGDSEVGHSPTLFLTETNPPRYVVQGWRTDEADQIEIPHGLLTYLEPRTCLGALLRDTGHGTFMLTGEPVTDAEALEQIQLPGHETAVVVPLGRQIRRDA